MTTPATRRPIGRPSKYTPELAERLATGLREGLFAEAVCEAEGIDPSTYRRWLADKPEFRTLIKRAEADQQREALARIRAGGEGWQSSAWFMERRYQREWALRVKQAIADAEDEAFRRLRDGLDEPTYLRVLAVLAGEEDKGPEPSAPLSPELLASMASAYGFELTPKRH